ncbi:substrate-binding domain-containing protein [Streptomyces sp. NBC_01476]|uniref:substrate-binding domain-containing protein n=1 Tax=Streptomyces sp. NBC_01476 TaxID=2903881 RepID=UPI002E3294E0|nr:substrate-binding domain-containing protein [Streptomyces sp. NBC_01476]
MLGTLSWSRHRRCVSALSVAGGALLLSACGSAGPGATEPGNPAAGSSQQPATVAARSVIAGSGVTSDTAFCGTKPITLGIQDGFGTNGWSQSSMAAVRSEAAKCPNVKQDVSIGQGDLQSSLSQINAMTAKGVDALVVIPDFGQSELPAIQAATRAGTKVVPWAADAGGTPGTDFVTYVDWDPTNNGKLWAQWMAKTLKGKGNVVYLAGPAGNPVSTRELNGINSVLSGYPGIKLLTGSKDWAVGNWDPAQAQKAMASLLSKYPTIDGVITDDGQGTAGALRAFTAAGRPLVPFTGLEVNQLGCAYRQLKPANPKFEMATISSRNWLGRVAARKAIAAAEGTASGEPSIYALPLLEDSTAGKAPACDSGSSQDTFLDSRLSPSDLATYGQAS